MRDGDHCTRGLYSMRKIDKTRSVMANAQCAACTEPWPDLNEATDLESGGASSGGYSAHTS